MEFAIVEVEFAIVEVEFAIAEVEFAIAEVEFATAEVEFATAEVFEVLVVFLSAKEDKASFTKGFLDMSLAEGNPVTKRV